MEKPKEPNGAPAAERTEPGKQGPARFDWLTVVITFGSIIGLYFPILLWLTERTGSEDQLLHSFIVLGMAFAYLLLDPKSTVSRLHLKHDSISIGLAAAAAIVLALHYSVFPGGFTILGSFCLALGCALRFTFGPATSRLNLAFLSAFVLYLVFVLVLPLLDWPLRSMAGQWSAWLLQQIGAGTALFLDSRGEELRLILLVGDTPFVVAPECNGFGILTASLLIATLLCVYHRISFGDILLLLGGTLVTAFLANVLRIFIIINLAPHVSHYMFMHEVVGLSIFYGTLIFIWWFIGGFGRSEGAKEKAA